MGSLQSFVKEMLLSRKQHTCSLVLQLTRLMNRIMQGDGGAVGLTENPVALRRWMVSGSEMTRCVRSNRLDKSSMTPTSTSALSTRQSPLEIQSR